MVGLSTTAGKFCANNVLKTSADSMTAMKLQILPIPNFGNVTAYCADSKIL